MVWSLELIKDIEDKNLFAGHLAMYMKEFDKAQVINLQAIIFIIHYYINIGFRNCSWNRLIQFKP